MADWFQDNIPHKLTLPCRIYFGKKKYIHIFLNFSIQDIAQVMEIFSHGRQEPTYLTKPMPCQLMPWQHKEPGHQLLWYWSSFTWNTLVSAPEGFIDMITNYENPMSYLQMYVPEAGILYMDK